MQIVSQSDFSNWLQDHVTKAYKIALAEGIGQIKEVLSTSAGLDQNEDNFRRGYITALQDALNFSIVDLQEAVNGD